MKFQIILLLAWATVGFFGANIFGESLPRGMGVGTAESMASVDQTAADLNFLHEGLDESAMDTATKNKASDLLTKTETAVQELRKSKFAPNADITRINEKSVGIRDGFDKAVLQLLNPGQIQDWANHAKIDFVQDTIMGDESMSTTVDQGGPGLNLTEQQQADIATALESRGKAMHALIQASPEAIEAKRTDAVATGRIARTKIRELLTAEQNKKYDQWTLDQISRLKPTASPTTKP